jgi:hypothetical protein
MLVKNLKDMDGINFMSLADFKEITYIKGRIKYDDIILVNRNLYRYSKDYKAIVKINNEQLTDEEISNELHNIDIQVYYPALDY